MAPRKNRKVKKYKSKDAESSSSVFILTDNVSNDAAMSLAGSAAINFTAKSLGLSESVDDATLLEGFASATNFDTEATSIILTQDLGKGDGVMPAQITKLQKSGRKIIKVSLRIKGKQNQDIAYQALPRVHYFKNPETYGDRFLDIHLGRDGRDLVIHYKRINGKTGVRRHTDVFIE